MTTEERILELRRWCREKASNCPKLKHDIMDLYDLAAMEIEDGGSATHEINLCMSDVQELIKENCN
jgi:hypothetical protein